MAAEHSRRCGLIKSINLSKQTGKNSSWFKKVPAERKVRQNHLEAISEQCLACHPRGRKAAGCFVRKSSKGDGAPLSANVLAGQNARKLVINAVLKTGFSFDTLQTPPNGPVCEIVDRTVAFFGGRRAGRARGRPVRVRSNQCPKQFRRRWKRKSGLSSSGSSQK